MNPGGYFLFADVIGKGKVAEIRNKLQSCGFNISSEKEITKNVARGLEMDTQRREFMIQKRFRGSFRNLLRNGQERKVLTVSMHSAMANMSIGVLC